MLIRLYDSYHAAAPEKTGIAYSAEGLTDLTAMAPWRWAAPG